jgi:NADH:ubiquinone oxidoreductase subunit E
LCQNGTSIVHSEKRAESRGRSRRSGRAGTTIADNATPIPAHPDQKTAATVAEHESACAKRVDLVDLTLLAPVLEEYASDSGALIPVLQRAQDIYGYLPREALDEIAEQRRTPFSQVYGVATFYAQFHLEPRGATIVRVCDGTACHVAGGPDVARAIVDALGVAVGETAQDGSFTVEAVACVGCCVVAPVVLVGEQVHGQVDPAGARTLAKRLLRETRP